MLKIQYLTFSVYGAIIIKPCIPCVYNFCPIVQVIVPFNNGRRKADITFSSGVCFFYALKRSAELYKILIIFSIIQGIPKIFRVM